jgi:hypothetical protein
LSSFPREASHNHFTLYLPSGCLIGLNAYSTFLIQRYELKFSYFIIRVWSINQPSGFQVQAGMSSIQALLYEFRVYGLSLLIISFAFKLFQLKSHVPTPKVPHIWLEAVCYQHPISLNHAIVL